MFNALARGIPSFGDLAWKAPVTFAGDPATPFNFPVPIMAPVGGYSPGQTLTKSGNGSINSEPPFTGAGLVVGNRILVTSEGTPENGIWVVTVVGTAGTPWKLTRATDADSAAELPTGATVLASAFLVNGVIHASRGLFVQDSGGSWNLEPQLLTSLTVLLSATIGDGSLDPALIVATGITMGAGSAIVGGAGPIVNVYLVAGSPAVWTPPAGLHHIVVEAQAGGGGGGGVPLTAAGQAAEGAHGGGGGYARKLLDASLLSGNYTVTTGDGGAGGVGGLIGTTGAASSFAGAGITTVQANPGVGGGTMAATAANAVVGGGAGGTATGGDLNIQGGSGANGLVVGAIPIPMGLTGIAVLGMPTRHPSTLSGAAGGTGHNFGAGGEGAINGASQAARNGSKAGAGIVIVTEYYGP